MPNLDLNDFHTKSKDQINQYVAAQIVGSEIVCTADAFGGNPLQSILMDLPRGLHVFGLNPANYKKDEGAVASNIEKFQHDLQTLLQQQFEAERGAELFKWLSLHYSQGPMMFASAPFGLFQSDIVLYSPSCDELKKEMIKRGNDIYIETTVYKIPVKQLEPTRLLGYIDNPLKVSFKLTDHGFVLDKMEIASQLIEDIYLNPTKINEAYIRRGMRDPNKRELFISELKQYEIKRMFEADRKPDHYRTRFLGMNWGFSSGVKQSAANKMHILLTGYDLTTGKLAANRDVKFNEQELAALRNSELGKLIKKYEKEGVLPEEYLHQVKQRDARELQQIRRYKL